MFIGEYEHNLDDRGRIIIPNKLREELGEQFVITPGTDGCLFIYPEKEWEKFIEKLDQLPGTMDGRKIQRYYTSGAVPSEMDKQGRVIIPQKLRDKVGIVKEVISVGVVNKIEIWAKDAWEAYNTFDSVDDIAEKMAEYGLKF